ncbi:hypothetical protein [Streptomyces sp. NBC_00513]|uniref:hypothetical protein n=1 Tax=Streptomyces sp. NBC_00513 TaxID=2975763 RepID=UPI00352C446B
MDEEFPPAGRIPSHALTGTSHRITRHVHEPAAEYGIGPSRRGGSRRIPMPERPAEATHAGPTRLTLL